MTARVAALLCAFLLAAGVAPATAFGNSDQGSWEVTGSLITGRVAHTATRLLDGRVLVVGGTSKGLRTAEAEAYFPVTGSWSPVAPLPIGRVGHTATLLADGRVLVTGGTDEGISFGELFDPAGGGDRRGSWAPTGEQMRPRSFHTATPLADGRVLITGGCSSACGGHIAGIEDPTASVVIFDPHGTDPVTGHRGMWTPAAPMLHARFLHTATQLADGRVLVTGGSDGILADPPVAPELLDLSIVDRATGRIGAWTSAGDEVPDGRRMDRTATRLLTGKVLLQGGVSATHGTSDNAAELYDPFGGSWKLTGPLRGPRSGNTATLLPDGTVLVAGGSAGRIGPLTSAELYLPETGHWTSLAPMHTAHSSHTATLLDREPCGVNCGKVLIAGGNPCHECTDFHGVIGAAAELFSPPGLVSRTPPIPADTTRLWLGVLIGLVVVLATAILAILAWRRRGSMGPNN